MPTSRTHAVVDFVDYSRHFARAVDGEGVDYFIYGNAVAVTGRSTFSDLCVGTKVRGIAIDHPKGQRLIEVDIIEL